MRKLFLPLIVTMLIITACSTAASMLPTAVIATPMPARPTPNSAELHVTDPAMTIEVTAGNEFTITVKTNSSPDLHWEIAQTLDSKIVAYVWKDHVSDNPNNSSDLSGVDVWRFEAVAPGKTTIALGYYQGDTTNTVQAPVYTVVVK